jgi:glycosyltransferase involved in cell wall biosynthesis
MRIGLLGTYPPTACGIATFTADLESALASAGIDVTVIPVVIGSCSSITTVDTCSLSVERDYRSSYSRAAAAANAEGFDVVLIQHEFGIFGGPSGDMVLEFAQALSCPYAVTLHTVLSPYDPHQGEVVRRLCNDAVAVTVFTPTARRLILEQELVHADRLHVVPHGAPVELYGDFDRDDVTAKLGLAPDDRVLSTFGLLSPGKGIELALSALPHILEQHPTAHYVIAGRTHPEVERREGLGYRDHLLQLSRQLGLGGHVTMIDRFLDIDELAELLSITEVFCTPYVGSEQSVSGALTFAVAAGCPTVSTPYRYARDLLSGGAGVLVPFGDHLAFAAAVTTLLDDTDVATTARDAATELSRAMQWPTIGRILADLLATSSRPSMPQPLPAASTGTTAGQNSSGQNSGGQTSSEWTELEIGTNLVSSTKPFTSDTESQLVAAPYLRTLCDDTAILQHAIGSSPRLDTGYCVDDAGRALPVLARLARRGAAAGPDPTVWRIAVARNLSFVHHAAGDRSSPAAMRNFMTWDRKWQDEPHQGDHVGRAVWGLGELAAEREDELAQVASELMLNIVAGFEPDAASSRTLAYMALGLAAAHHDQRSLAKLSGFEPALNQWTLRPNVHGWQWFESRLTYDNARIPETLITVGRLLNNEQLVDRGIDMLEWLDRLCRRNDHYRFPGHRGLEPGTDVRISGDEQPLEAAAMADAHAAAWLITGNADHLAAIDRAWTWFLGNNRLGIALGNLASGACYDGLCTSGVNANCGAESTLAFLRCEQTSQRSGAWRPTASATVATTFD